MNRNGGRPVSGEPSTTPCRIGSGYYGRRLEQTPRNARILAVAETYDAMTTSLVKERLPQDHALAILRDRQEHYDVDCVTALSEAVRPRPGCIPVTRWP